MLLPHISAVLLGIGALFGMRLAIGHLSGKPPPLKIAIVHGLLVAPGLIILLIALALHGRAQGRGNVSRFDQPHEVLMGIAAGIFLLGAMGGLIMVVRHAKRKPLPAVLVVIHGLAGLTGYTMLIVSLFM